MAWDVIVRTDAGKLQELETKLKESQEKMLEGVDQLNRAYHKVQWNDMVSESVRLELNYYIKNLNEALAELEGVIFGVSQMRQIAAEYESMK